MSQRQMNRRDGWLVLLAIQLCWAVASSSDQQPLVVTKTITQTVNVPVYENQPLATGNIESATTPLISSRSYSSTAYSSKTHAVADHSSYTQTERNIWQNSTKLADPSPGIECDEDCEESTISISGLSSTPGSSASSDIEPAITISASKPAQATSSFSQVSGSDTEPEITISASKSTQATFSLSQVSGSSTAVITMRPFPTKRYSLNFDNDGHLRIGKKTTTIVSSTPSTSPTIVPGELRDPTTGNPIMTDSVPGEVRDPTTANSIMTSGEVHDPTIGDSISTPISVPHSTQNSFMDNTTLVSSYSDAASFKHSASAGPTTHFPPDKGHNFNDHEKGRAGLDSEGSSTSFRPPESQFESAESEESVEVSSSTHLPGILTTMERELASTAQDTSLQESLIDSRASESNGPTFSSVPTLTSSSHHVPRHRSLKHGATPDIFKSQSHKSSVKASSSATSLRAKPKTKSTSKSKTQSKSMSKSKSKSMSKSRSRSTKAQGDSNSSTDSAKDRASTDTTSRGLNLSRLSPVVVSHNRTIPYRSSSPDYGSYTLLFALVAFGAILAL